MNSYQLVSFETNWFYKIYRLILVEFSIEKKGKKLVFGIKLQKKKNI